MDYLLIIVKGAHSSNASTPLITYVFYKAGNIETWEQEWNFRYLGMHVTM